jgi:SAM-dependent methyltransferase
MRENLEATARYWDSYVAEHMVDGQNTNRAEWLAHPTVQKHHRMARGYREFEPWVAEVVLEGSPRARGVGIGAGAGSAELKLLAQGSVERFDLIDISEGSLELAHQQACELGVGERMRTIAGDLATMDLGDRCYDIATCMGSLHHAVDLDQLVTAAARSLVDEGLLVAYEYVGPDRFATGSVERQLAQQLYRSLDPALRSTSPDLPLPDPTAVADADPTEAVHSSQIISTLERHFEDVAIVHHGGALTYTLWWGMNHDALYETKAGWDFVNVLLTMDEALTRTGVIDDYFVTITANGPVG